MAASGADDRDRTGDLVLTKDALCLLSYIGLRASRYGRQVGRRQNRPDSLTGLPTVARRFDPAASEGWSGRRGSNPRPTAWKAVTLPLSYSRLRVACTPTTLRRGRPAALRQCPSPRSRWLPQPKRRRRGSGKAKAGGEGRIRTSEAAGAADLQSAAFDRSATSPRHPLLRSVASTPRHRARCVVRGFVLIVDTCRPCCALPGTPGGALARVELAEGFEPPTG